MGCLLPSLFGGHVLVFNSFLAFLHCNGAEKAERKKLAAGTGCEGCTFSRIRGSESLGGAPVSAWGTCRGALPRGHHQKVPWACCAPRSELSFLQGGREVA